MSVAAAVLFILNFQRAIASKLSLETKLYMCFVGILPLYLHIILCIYMLNIRTTRKTRGTVAIHHAARPIFPQLLIDVLTLIISAGCNVLAVSMFETCGCVMQFSTPLMPLPLWLSITIKLSLIRKENMMNGFVR